jgi:hypothetical protein
MVESLLSQQLDVMMTSLSTGLICGDDDDDNDAILWMFMFYFASLQTRYLERGQYKTATRLPSGSLGVSRLFFAITFWLQHS